MMKNHHPRTRISVSKNGTSGLPLASVKIREKSHKLPLVIFDQLWKIAIDLVGKSSLSVGHFQRQTVTNYQAGYHLGFQGGRSLGTKTCPREIAAEMGTPKMHQHVAI
jgi:hypothetical protein